jgi:hypothetical protein
VTQVTAVARVKLDFVVRFPVQPGSPVTIGEAQLLFERLALVVIQVTASGHAKP